MNCELDYEAEAYRVIQVKRSDAISSLLNNDYEMLCLIEDNAGELSPLLLNLVRAAIANLGYYDQALALMGALKRLVEISVPDPDISNEDVRDAKENMKDA